MDALLNTPTLEIEDQTKHTYNAILYVYALSYMLSYTTNIIKNQCTPNI